MSDLSKKHLQPLHRYPDQGVLYQVIADNINTVYYELESKGKYIPSHVRKEFESYLACGIYCHGFTRLQCVGECKQGFLLPFSCKCRGFCNSCIGRRMAQTSLNLTDYVLPNIQYRQWVLSIPIVLRYVMARDSTILTKVQRVLVKAIRSYFRRQARKEGIRDAEIGVISVIQLFGGSVNLNPHFHLVVSDGFFYKNNKGVMTFKPLKPPVEGDIAHINKKIHKKVNAMLLKAGIIDEETNHYQGELFTTDDATTEAKAASIRRKISVGANRGGKVKQIGKFYDFGWHPPHGQLLNYHEGFSLHAGVSIKASDRKGLEQLISYTLRPPIPMDRLTYVGDDKNKIRFKLKRPYDDGTHSLEFTGVELVEKLISIIPKAKMNLVRYFGVFSANYKHRLQIVPGVKHKKKVVKGKITNEYWIPWAELLRRTFQLDVSICTTCKGLVRVIAVIKDPKIIHRILGHLHLPTAPPSIAPARSPPTLPFDDWI